MRLPYSPPTITSRSKCLIDGCDRPEELANGRSAGGLCSSHRKRKQQGRPLEEPIHERMGLQRDGTRRMSPRQALVHAAMDLADIDTGTSSDVDWRRGVDRLIHAAVRYAGARADAEGRKLPSK